MLRRLGRRGHPDSEPADSAIPAPRSAPELPEWPEISHAERMASVEFRVDEEPHIVVDTDVCRGCVTRECMRACPADLFVATADGGVTFYHDQCFECGLCAVVCPCPGAITWSYPQGGHGVVFRWG